MTQLFYTVFHMSIGACFVIAVVLIARLLLRRAPRKYCYALWLVVLFRLLCPVSFQSAFSLFSFTGAPAHLMEGGFGTAPVALDGSSNQQNQLQALDEGKNTGQMPAGGGALKQEHVLEWEDILTLIWIAGIVVLAGYSAVGTHFGGCLVLPHFACIGTILLCGWYGWPEFYFRSHCLQAILDGTLSRFIRMGARHIYLNTTLILSKAQGAICSCPGSGELLYCAKYVRAPNALCGANVVDGHCFEW